MKKVFIPLLVTLFAVSCQTTKQSVVHQIIYTEQAPKPIGPYSQAVKVGNTLYVAGQIAIDPQTNAMVTESFEKEAEQVMTNLVAVLKAAGMTPKNIVKTSIFLKDMNDFQTVNTIYGKYFEKDFPARETIQVAALPKGARVEISVIAVD